MSDDLYDIARRVTDGVLGDGTYAEINKNNPDPGVQAAIQRASTETAEAGQPKAGRSWVLRCDCCGQLRASLPFHHHHRDTNRETDYCQFCYDTGCDLLSCSL